MPREQDPQPAHAAQGSAPPASAAGMTAALKQHSSAMPWGFLLLGCLLCLISFGLRAGWGVFLAPITESMGWGREVFSLAIAFQMLLWGFAQPVASAFADRYGPLRVLVPGALLYALGLFLMRNPSSPLWFQFTAGVLTGVGMAMASFTIVMALMAHSVPEHRRSTALGMGTAAASLGMFLIVPMNQTLIDLQDWRFALAMLALLALTMAPLSFGMNRTVRPIAQAGSSLGNALRGAFALSGYRYLLAGFFVCGFHVGFIQTHLPGYVNFLGLHPQVGAWGLALIGLFNIVGSYGAGMLGERLSRKNLLSGIYLGRAIVITGFITLPPSAPSVLLFSALMGLLWLATVPLTTGLVAHLCGMRYLATLSGIVFLSHQMGAFLGVWLGGALFDATGSYELIWWVAVALSFAAALVHLPIREVRVLQPAMP